MDALDPFKSMKGKNERGDFLRICQIVIGPLDPPGGAFTHENEGNIVSR